MRTFAAATATLFLAAALPFSAQASDTFPAEVQALVRSSIDQPHNRVETTLMEYVDKMAECEAPKAFLPYSINTGGRATIGIRCQGREQTPIYVTAQVKVFGRYWVPTVEIARGAVIEPSMLSEKTGDLSRLPRNIIQDPKKIIGLQVNRSLRPGKPVQESALQAVYLVKRNAIVDVQAVGAGFMIKRDGVAMGNGAMGDSVTVKLKGGDTVRATVTAKNVLNIDI